MGLEVCICHWALGSYVDFTRRQKHGAFHLGTVSDYKHIMHEMHEERGKMEDGYFPLYSNIYLVATKHNLSISCDNYSRRIALEISW